MTPFEEQLQVWQGKMRDLATFVNDALFEELKRDESLIEDLQRDRLFDGKDANDKPIVPSYTPFTVRTKKAKGQPFDRVTLKDKGNFYRGIYASSETSSLVINSRDSKTHKLTAKYGNDIFGLTPVERDNLLDIYKPELQIKLRQWLKK